MQQSVCCIQDKKDFYCIIGPQNCLDEAQQIQYSSVVKCKFCKSIQVITIQCPLVCSICKSQVDVPKGKQIMGESSKLNIQILKSVEDSIQVHSPLQILLLFDQGLGESFASGFICLRDILPRYADNSKICCIFYSSEINLVELREGGRIIKLNQDTFELINDHFYNIGEEQLDTLSEYLQGIREQETKINGSKILYHLLNELTTRTAVIWVSSINEQTQFIVPQSKSFVQIYGFFRIPTRVSNLNMSKILPVIQNSLRKIILIPVSTDKTQKEEEFRKQQIIDQIHYQLYDLLEICPGINYSIETSRQKKHPPQILTKKHCLFAHLNESIIIKLTQEIIQGEKIQVRLFYKDLQTNKKTIVWINFVLQKVYHSREDLRFLKLYLSMEIFKKTRRQSAISIQSTQERDIFNFLNESSLLHIYELMLYIERYPVLYMVWPWIGFSHSKPVFVYFFTGYYFRHQLCMKEDDQNLATLKNNYEKYFCRKHTYQPTFYNNLFECISEQRFEDSDGQDSEQHDENLTYYKFQFQIL